jgi:hypothetical protein
MKKRCLILILPLFTFFGISNTQAKKVDSLIVINSQYDSILKSDHQEMNILFYKHQNEVLINNLGPFGSPSYYTTAFSLRHKNLIVKKDILAKKLYKLSGFKPYSTVTYINASRKEQHFYLRHIQEWGKLLHFDFDFKKISSPGAYLNQEVNTSLFEGALSFRSKKGNYSAKFSTGIYRDFYQQNGGLVDIEQYELEFFDDAQNYSVNLSNSNSFMKKYSYELGQYLDLLNFDSDSLVQKNIYLRHQVNFTTYQKVFFDNDSSTSFYLNSYLDPVSSIDSIFSNTMSNTIYIGATVKNLSVELFGQYDQINYFQSVGLDTSFQNTYLGIGSKFDKEELSIEGIAKYGLNGYREGDIDVELNIVYDHKKYVIEGGGGYFFNEADLKFKNYSSNHFKWENTDLIKQSILDINMGIKLKKIQLEFKAVTKLFNNTLFYDSLAIASQDSGQALISSFLLAKDYRLLNFHFRTAFIYQLTSDELLFPIPNIIGRQVLYYQKKIFKGAMKFQCGLSFSYSTNYFGYSYMPAINEYTKQGGGTEMGFYPRVDLFINTHLKRAQIFLKYEHFNSGRSLQKSILATGYPPMGKSLKFGVSWNMFD